MGDRVHDVKVVYICTDLTLETAQAYEIYYQLLRRHQGYKIVGLIGNKTDKEFHDLQSSKLKGKNTEPEKKIKMVKTRKANGKPWHSEDTKAKIRGHKCTEETREKIRKSKLGKPGMKGQSNPMSRTNRLKRLTSKQIRTDKDEISYN